MYILYSAILIFTLCVLLWPFWKGQDGLLLAASYIDDPGQIKQLKETILKNYLRDEAAFKKGSLSKSEWKQREEFLTHFYIDLSRRQDFMKTQ